MKSVQGRLREISSARIKAYSGVPPEPELLPKNRAVIKLPISNFEQRNNGLPAYLLADALLHLPPDTDIVMIDDIDYGNMIAVVVMSREFPDVKHGECPPSLDVKIEDDHIEVDGGRRFVRRIRSIEFGGINGGTF